MDLITQREVWDTIENAKNERAIILITHSMKEADKLSDRIAIMAKGTLCCIGTSIHLKSKFVGTVVNVNFTKTTADIAESNRQDLKKLFKDVRLY